jgi:CBS domain-containing protein
MPHHLAGRHRRTAPTITVLLQKEYYAEGLKQKEEKMIVRDIMSRNVETIRPDSVIQEAASKMQTLDVGSLPVCDNQRLLGVVTDRDITIRAVASGLDPRSTKVSDTMTPELIYCYEDEPVREAAKLMERHQIRRLPILNRNKQLVGIVSLGDLAVETGNEKLSGKVLEEVSEPNQPKQ